MSSPLQAPIPVMDQDTAFMFFFRHNNSAMWIFDIHTLAFLDVNESAIRQYGYQRAQFLNMTLKDIRKPEQVNSCIEYIRRFGKTDTAPSTWEHLKADGSSIAVNISAFRVNYYQKEAKLVTVTDITPVIQQKLELWKANQELCAAKKEQEHLSLVATLTGNKVMITDAQANIQWINPSFVHKTGYTLEEVKGKKPSEVLHGPLSSAETLARIKTAVIAGQPIKEEIVHYHKNGEAHWILLDGQPVKDEHGKTLEYVMVDTDITDLKEKEAAIALSEMKLDALLNSTNSLHLLFDQHLQLQAYNQVAIDFAKHKLEKSLYIGMKIGDIAPDPLRKNFIHFSNLALSGTNTLNRKVQIADDTWWMVNYMTVRDSFGNIMGIAYTAVDITDLKKAEEKINQQNETLKNIAWKQSHIVRAPVSNILAISQLLQNDPADPALLHSLQQETNKLDVIIRDIVTETAGLYQNTTATTGQKN
jgi:PAS domain S-box-containing protein